MNAVHSAIRSGVMCLGSIALCVGSAGCRSASSADPTVEGALTGGAYQRVLRVLPAEPAAKEADRASAHRLSAMRLVGGAEFWKEHGVVLVAHAAEPWVTPDDSPELLLDLVHDGSKPLRIAVREKRPLLSFRAARCASAVVDVRSLMVSVGRGQQIEQDRLGIELFEEDLVLEPGTRRRFVLPLPAAARGADYFETSAQVTLFPLSIRFGDEPEKFVALTFPSVILRGCSQRALENQPVADWERSLDEVLDQEPRATVGWAMRRRELDVLRVVDLLQSRLPGKNRECRVSLLGALRWVTGLELEPEVEIWRSWWSSAAGAQWARERRRSMDLHRSFSGLGSRG